LNSVPSQSSIEKITHLQPPKLLLVEDDEDLKFIIEDVLLSKGYEVIAVTNGIEALEKLSGFAPDLIISDLMMPHMDGFTLLQRVRNSPNIGAIPFVIITAYTSNQEARRARELGADDFLVKPFTADDLLTLIRTRLQRSQSIYIFNTREAHLQTVLMLANVIEARDEETHKHVERVQKLAVGFGQALGWGPDKTGILEIGSVLHDIGKIMVPRTILNKRGPLNKTESELIRQHPYNGARMLTGVTHLAPAIPYVLYHHERWDGQGYPFGLASDHIPIEGRMLALVDAYDAMTSNRPYRAGMPHDQAVREIIEHRGTQFDPTLTDQFLQVIANHTGA
jgi:putative two-component system response regulator